MYELGKVPRPTRGSIIFALLSLALPYACYGATCEGLSSISLPNGTVTSAEVVDAGKFVPPAPPQGLGAFGGAPPRVNDLPAFCRIRATLKPSSDSDIRTEFWMPVSGWNGRLQPTAAGVFLGMLNYASMANILRTGAATATSDNGHEGGSAGFALGHPEKLKDFAERAGHLTLVDAKLLIHAFYGKGPNLSLMNECGGGGRTAMTEVQRYPDDLDLAMVGGLDTHSTHHTIGQMWVWQAAHRSPESYIPAEKYSILNSAALAACDAKDGAKDGLIQDPAKCNFDPARVQCQGADTTTCLTPEQVDTARKIYSPVRNSRTGEYLIGGLMAGSELGGALWPALNLFPTHLSF
jgi:feruloyl esterase